MATAAPELSLARLWPAALLWVVLHLAGMAVLLGCTRAWACRLSRLQLQALATGVASLALWCAVLWPADAWRTLGVMVLWTLAWTLEPAHRFPGSAATAATARCMMLLSGPLGLWLILSQWPTRGADVLWLALTMLSAATVLLWTVARLRTVLTPVPLELSHEQH